MTRTIPFKPVKAEAIDLDSNSQFQMLKRLYNARALGKTVRLMRSPSGRGYHIHAEEGFTLHEAMMLSDCKGRIWYWLQQGYTFTFGKRLNWRGCVVGREETENVLAKPFWSRLVRRRRWKNG